MDGWKDGRYCRDKESHIVIESDRKREETGKGVRERGYKKTKQQQTTTTITTLTLF